MQVRGQGCHREGTGNRSKVSITTRRPFWEGKGVDVIVQVSVSQIVER